MTEKLDELAAQYHATCDALGVIIAARGRIMTPEARAVYDRHHDQRAWCERNPVMGGFKTEPDRTLAEKVTEIQRLLDDNSSQLSEAKTSQQNALKACLAAVGDAAGRMVACDADGCLGDRVKRAWGYARDYRLTRLDGVDLLSVPVDPEGPCAKAFSKALGYKTAVEMVKDIHLVLSLEDGDMERIGVARLRMT